MKQHVLIVEDDLLLANTLQRVLKNHDFSATITTKVETGFSFLETYECQLVVLDLNLPDGSGFRVLEYLTQYAPNIKVLVLSRDHQIKNKITSFEKGAADFVAKPCQLQEFLLRVERLSRWRWLPKQSQALTIKDIQLLPDSGQVFLKGNEIKLRRREFQILECLAHHKQRIITSQELLVYVWGAHSLPVHNTIQVYMSKLRAIFGDDFPIETIRGMGYRINN